MPTKVTLQKDEDMRTVDDPVVPRTLRLLLPGFDAVEKQRKK